MMSVDAAIKPITGEHCEHGLPADIAHRNVALTFSGRSPGSRVVNMKFADLTTFPCNAQWYLAKLILVYRCGGSVGIEK